jgi:hypothetical protein
MTVAAALQILQLAGAALGGLDAAVKLIEDWKAAGVTQLTPAHLEQIKAVSPDAHRELSSSFDNDPSYGN